MNILNIIRPNYNECHVNDIPVDSSIIVKNKLFNEDILNEDLSLKVSMRDEFLIGGVIKFKNLYTFGFNEKDMELFEFVPINWKYPRFLVPTNIKKNLIKNKKKVIDYFVVIKFKEWKSKLPIGQIEKCLGPVDEIINQYDILFNYYPTMPIVKPEPLPMEIKKHDLTIHTDVYSIDPEGCIDIDDALSYDFKDNRIGIHIADVADIIDEYNFNKYSTVYAPHKNIPMFPENISTFIASLREGQLRKVITCWITEDGTYNFEENCIKVTKNLTYDNAETLKENNNILKMLYDKSIELGKKINIEVIDTHKMVEVYMILYNQYITELLEKRKNMIFRNQKLYGKAIYESRRTGHESLGLTHYTHASSPIRRYVDWIIQKIFKNKEFQHVELNEINEFEKKIKKLNRMWDYLKASKEITNGEFFEIEFREIQDERLNFWCEKLNITISNKIPYKIIEENIIEINNKQYKIGEKYNMQLYLVDDKKNILFYKILIQF